MNCWRCGHGQNAHGHYRVGTDCVLCDCPRWRRPGSLRRAARVVLRLVLLVVCIGAGLAVGAWMLHGMVLLTAAIP